MTELTDNANKPRMGSLRSVALASFILCSSASALAWFWLVLIDAERGFLEAIGCLAPSAMALVLAQSSQIDRQQYVVRLLACCAMLPILLMMWVGSQDAGANVAQVWPAWGWLKRPWVYFSIWAAIHTLLFLASIWWLAAAVTRVEAAPGAMRVDSTRLGQRLQSLTGASLPLDITAPGVTGQWQLNIRLPPSAGRAHRVLLNIDEAAAQVLVRERLSLSDAAPSNENEASMRSLGDEAFDPARPEAQKIAGRSIQTTMVHPDRLAAVRLQLTANGVQLLDAAPTEPEAIVTLLCALVTRSGYAWQPVMGRWR